MGCFSKVFARTHALPKLHFIHNYHDHPLYIQALAQSVRRYWQEHGQGEKLLMSFHGIPERYEDRGDPILANAVLRPHCWHKNWV